MKQLYEHQETSFLGRLRTIGAGYAFMLFWCVFVKFFLTTLYNTHLQWSIEPQPGPLYLFFFMCIWAPLWEELAFRYAPMKIAKILGKKTILPIAIISSMLFGWGHGYGPISLLFQGVMGFTFCCVYIKNGFSYWSTVFLHFLWNFSLSYAIPYFMGT